MCGCGCISCAWPASSPRSARRTCAFPSARPASCSPPRASRCPRPGRRCCTSGPRGGPRACGSRCSRWLVTPTRSGSSRSSPAATARSRSTCSPRCWTAGRPGSEQILLSLEDANAFVVSLDPERTWFRYHHLFADFLRLELRRTLPEEVPALHRRAAGWFTVQGQVVNAIRHTQAAGDWADAARLLADYSFSLTLDGQAQTIQALVRAFPPGTDHPELALVRAMGDLVQGRLDEAAAHLAVAEAHVRTAPPDRRRRLGVAVASLQLALA